MLIGGNAKFLKDACPEDATSPGSSPWKGQLELSFRRRNRETCISHSYARAPLAMQSPFYPEGREVCHCIVLNPPGGIAGDDILEIDLNLEAGAKVLMTTPSSGKLYRTKGVESRQTIHIHIGEGASLEWLPQGTIFFDGALASQEMKVLLEPGATFMFWDMTRFGRTHRGERFQRGIWRSSTEVWQGEVPLWVDRQKLEGGTRLLDSPYGLSGQSVIGQMVLLGQEVSPSLIDQVRSTWNPEENQGEAGVTRLQSGLLCRYRGSSTIEAHRWFTVVWALLRPVFLEREICPPRIWNT